MLANCWAHARRKLREVYERDGSTIAAEGLRRIAEFYRIEAEVRGRPPEARLAARQQRTVPLVQAFKLWLKQVRARVSAKSQLGEKLAYIARNWAGLEVFLTDGRVEIDSNAVENKIRPLALNRKNALFAGHDEGAPYCSSSDPLINEGHFGEDREAAGLAATVWHRPRGAQLRSGYPIRG